ncbi:hypothetical protein RHO14_02355 [Orbus wheelerorum]|uniref:hypothetical protein n=1 Tax=Orbus wheelerorum TaxID=3074111 RepID=UPI00370D4F16
MTKQDMIEILRARTVRAILNHCVGKFGSTTYYKDGRPLFLTRDELSHFLIFDVEDVTKEEQHEQAELIIINFYSDMLDYESTAETVKLRAVSLSLMGIEFIEGYFNEFIKALIKSEVDNGI